MNKFFPFLFNFLISIIGIIELSVCMIIYHLIRKNIMNHYSFFGKILHDIILGNKFVSASLFEIEKIIFLKKN